VSTKVPLLVDLCNVEIIKMVAVVKQLLVHWTRSHTPHLFHSRSLSFGLGHRHVASFIMKTFLEMPAGRQGSYINVPQDAQCRRPYQSIISEQEPLF